LGAECIERHRTRSPICAEGGSIERASHGYGAPISQPISLKQGEAQFRYAESE